MSRVNDKIRVLQLVTRMDVGGVPEHILTLVQGLAGEGFDVTVACSHISEPIKLKLETLGVTIRIITMRRLVHPADLLAGWQLYKYLRQEKFHIVHTHMSKAALLGGCVAHAAGVPVVVNTAHNLGCIALSNRVLRVLFWAYDKVLFALTMDAVIVVSETIRKQIIACRLLPERKVYCIFNGIDANPFINTDEKKVSILKNSFGLAEIDFVIGTVARLVWFKGLQTLLAALPSVLATCQKTRLLIVGDGPLRQELEQQSRQLGIHEHVFFLGEREDVPDLLALFDVFVLPSVSEGMPITILEAMAAAKPIVATHVGGIPDTVSEGQTALLVQARDPSALAEAIIRLYQDQNLRINMGKAARACVLSDFTGEKMIGRTVHLYNSLLGANQTN